MISDNRFTIGNFDGGLKMETIRIKKDFLACQPKEVLSYELKMAPGLYDISLFVWANGALGQSMLSANGKETGIYSNGAVQIDGIRTIDEIMLEQVQVCADEVLKIELFIDDIDPKISGTLENLVIKKSTVYDFVGRVYLEIEPDTTIKNLENGYYTLRAKTSFSGGDDICYLYGHNGVTEMRTAIPRNNFPYESGKDLKTVTLRGIHVTTGTLTVGVKCMSGQVPTAYVTDFTLEKDDLVFNYYNGGDITELTYTEDNGGKYYDFNDNQRDPLELLAEHGWNMVRIRIYNHPGKGRGNGVHYLPENYQDTTDALKLAKRAKAAGLHIQLSFHYSDYWTNPGQQITPHAWAQRIYGKSEEEAVAILETEVYEFTKDVLTQLKNQQTIPHIISVGNETRNGMLYPYGHTDNFENLAKFYQAGTRAIREVVPEGIAMIHLDDGGNLNTYLDHFKKVDALGVDFDMIGTSYYPYWTQKTAAKFGSFAKDVARAFNKPLMIMEAAINYTANTGSGRVGQLTNNGPYGDKESSTPQLQRDFMIELLNEMQSVENGMCVGSMYWDPIMIYANGKTGWAYLEETDEQMINVIDNTTLFDFEGRALPVLNAYKYNKRK